MMTYKEFQEKTFYTKEEILALTQGLLVSDAPAEFVRLPAPPMLMVDRILEIEQNGNKGRIVAEKDVVMDEWFFQCHFRADPVQPGCLGVDAIWQLLGFYQGRCGAQGSGRALGCKEVVFDGQIRPYNKLIRYEVEVRRYVVVKGGEASLAVGTGKVIVDGEHIYTIHDAKVGIFKGIAYPDYPKRSENSVGGIMER